jgi:hypothetical protein
MFFKYCQITLLWLKPAGALSQIASCGLYATNIIESQILTKEISLKPPFLLFL